MARMLGCAFLGESQEEFDRIASEDQFLAQHGYVELRRGNRVWTKHIDELTREDRLARIEFEKTLVMWLRGRVETEKIMTQLRERGVLGEG